MDRTKKINALIFLGTLLYLAIGGHFMVQLVNQGGSDGVENFGYWMSDWGVRELQRLGNISAVLGFAMMGFSFALKKERVGGSPVKSFLLVLALSAPIALLFQAVGPEVIARTLVTAFPSSAKQAVDAYYAKRLLETGHVTIPGMAGFNEKALAERRGKNGGNLAGANPSFDTQQKFFAAHLYFMLPDVAQRIRPAYTSEELPRAFLYYVKHPEIQTRKIDFARLTAAQKVALEDDYQKIIAPVSDLERVKQMIFIPYSLMLSSIMLTINAVIGVTTLAGMFLFGRKLRWVNVIAVLVVLGTLPVRRVSALTNSDGYQAIIANEDVTLLGSDFMAGMLQFEISVLHYIHKVDGYVPFEFWRLLA